MNSKRTISLTEARRRIFELADEVQKPDVQFTLTAKGKPKAVIMSAEEYESLLETLEVKAYFPNLEEDIAEAERDIREGKTVPLEEVFKKEKGRDVSRRAHPARKKRSQKG